MKKKQEEKYLAIVKDALRHWDPIGVIDFSDEGSITDNEYDSYASGLLSFLEGGANAKGIANHLAQVRSVSMCLGSSRHSEREDELGEKLVAWRDGGYKGNPDFGFTRYAF